MHGPVVDAALPIILFVVCVAGLAVFLLLLGNVFSPGRPGRVKRMPYESGMDPIHDARRRFNVRFHLVAIAFLVFDVELLFLYPWAVVFQSKPAATSSEQLGQPNEVGSSASAAAAADPRGDVAGRVLREGRPPWIFAAGMIFVGLLVLGFIYDWRKGIFEWR